MGATNYIWGPRRLPCMCAACVRACVRACISVFMASHVPREPRNLTRDPLEIAVRSLGGIGPCLWSMVKLIGHAEMGMLVEIAISSLEIARWMEAFDMVRCRVAWGSFTLTLPGLVLRSAGYTAGRAWSRRG